MKTIIEVAGYLNSQCVRGGDEIDPIGGVIAEYVCADGYDSARRPSAGIGQDVADRATVGAVERGRTVGQDARHHQGHVLRTFIFCVGLASVVVPGNLALEVAGAVGTRNALHRKGLAGGVRACQQPMLQVRFPKMIAIERRNVGG